ncbi:Hypothetical predicted protein [Marmota monax]|uniref:Albumin n=1 Tax=Marmota monax TaxID=9995 RepID=A0A5E4CKC6_MARMO|nr:hypothetical protein GHT09_011903 [Marmota monax]VTJ82323.1 Hypothetical predicted protein [Marmota monax]
MSLLWVHGKMSIHGKPSILPLLNFCFPSCSSAVCSPEFIVCVMHEKNPVSESVTKCCSESFLNKWICFSALQVDDTCSPKEFNAETFTFHADICTLLETEQQIKKQM